MHARAHRGICCLSLYLPHARPSSALVPVPITTLPPPTPGPLLRKRNDPRTPSLPFPNLSSLCIPSCPIPSHPFPSLPILSHPPFQTLRLETHPPVASDSHCHSTSPWYHRCALVPFLLVLCRPQFSLTAAHLGLPTPVLQHHHYQRLGRTHAPPLVNAARFQPQPPVISFLVTTSRICFDTRRPVVTLYLVPLSPVPHPTPTTCPATFWLALPFSLTSLSDCSSKPFQAPTCGTNSGLCETTSKKEEDDDEELDSLPLLVHLGLDLIVSSSAGFNKMSTAVASSAATPLPAPTIDRDLSPKTYPPARPHSASGPAVNGSAASTPNVTPSKDSGLSVDRLSPKGSADGKHSPKG